MISQAYDTTAAQEDDFAHFARELARARGQNPDSLNKKLKVSATASVLRPGIGAQTIKAIHKPGEYQFHKQGHPAAVDECWETPFPSAWYVNPNAVGGYNFRDTATDLLFRPSDKFTLGRAHFEPKREEDKQAARVAGGLVSSFINNGTVKATGQVGGTHYGNPATDVYAFSMANDLDALQFNVVKYVTRFRKKDGLKDLKKALHTLERLIAHEEGRK